MEADGRDDMGSELEKVHVSLSDERAILFLAVKDPDAEERQPWNQVNLIKQDVIELVAMLAITLRNMR